VAYNDGVYSYAELLASAEMKGGSRHCQSDAAAAAAAL